jgi:hypothetical protein
MRSVLIDFPIVGRPSFPCFEFEEVDYIRRIQANEAKSELPAKRRSVVSSGPFIEIDRFSTKF